MAAAAWGRTGRVTSNESMTPPPHTRRSFLHQSLAWSVATICAPPLLLRAENAPKPDAGVIDIGSRRELFVDDFLVERLAGGATLRLHHPEPREIALVHDAPWEGSGSIYHSVFKDGGIFRMYYKGMQLDVSKEKVGINSHPPFCCYAESDDGIHWRKPELGLHEFNGSKANNIVIASGKLGALNVDAGAPAVLKDENPAAAADARYKAFMHSSKPNGLIAFKSPDGIHWSPMTDAPLLVTLGAFDSLDRSLTTKSRPRISANSRVLCALRVARRSWRIR